MKFTLQRVRLNSGGYTDRGFYYGVGLPLYWYCSDDCQCEDYIRASSRETAKTIIRDKHPTIDVRFYR